MADPEELATLRWLCNWEPETIARFVVMVRAQLLAELEAEHEILRARRERAAADLIDRVLPDPTVPKGER